VSASKYPCVICQCQAWAFAEGLEGRLRADAIAPRETVKVSWQCAGCNSRVDIHFDAEPLHADPPVTAADFQAVLA
jgi:hypothetical protein